MAQSSEKPGAGLPVNVRWHTVNKPSRRWVSKKDRDGAKSSDSDKGSDNLKDGDKIGDGDKDGDTRAAIGASDRGEAVETAADLDSEAETSVEKQVRPGRNIQLRRARNLKNKELKSEIIC
jgi:hypothetical protein